MTFNQKDWLAPKIVRTPNIEDDIKRHLGSEVLELWRKSTDDIRKTIVFIVERLDFISHLKAFGKYTSDKSEKVFQKISNTEYEVEYKFEWEGHDYSGVQFDIEALILYLLLTCIDAIQSQAKYKNPFEWLKERITLYQHKNEDEISRQLDIDENKYGEKFGLCKNFVKAFISDIPAHLNKEIAENLMVVKNKDGSPNKASLSSWMQKKEEEKVKKIASYLYSLRSKYTHNSIRNFIPTHEMTFLYIEGEVLLCKKGCNLECLLWRVITELCLIKLKQ